LQPFFSPERVFRRDFIRQVLNGNKKNGQCYKEKIKKYCTIESQGEIAMGISLSIPDSIVQAMKLPPRQRKRQLMIELSLSLYSQGILSLGKARELAGVDKRTFSVYLGDRAIPRHYEEEDLEDDLNYARGE
jgi:predicted HTH domain antitoxin